MFVKLLQGAFRLSHCTWLSGTQEFHVQECIKTLSNIGKFERISGSIMIELYNVNITVKPV